MTGSRSHRGVATPGDFAAGWRALGARLHGREAWVVALAAALLCAVVQALMHHETQPRGDDLIYEKMAEHPFATHTFPFAYRLGVPTLVHVLPFGHRTSFLLLAIVCAGGAAGVLYSLMTTLATSRSTAVALALLFVLSPGILIVFLRNGRNTDAATVLIMAAAALFTVREQLVPLALTLLVGAFVRESCMFMIPFAYAVWATRPLDLGALRRLALVAAPALAVYVVVRLAVPTTGRTLVVGYANDGFVHERLHVLRVGLDGALTQLRRIFLEFGPLWLLAPFALGGMRYARRGLVLVLLCAFSLTYALDWGRVLLLAAPVVYPAAGWALTRHGRWRIPTLAVWVAVIVVYTVYMQVSGVAHNINGAHPPSYPTQ